MRCPAQLYTASARPNTGIPEPQYPFHDKTVLVTRCGQPLPLSQEDQLEQITSRPSRLR